MTPHTLRHSFASTAADLGFTELTVGALIGHRTGTVTSRYVHQLDKVLIAAADRVARQIETWMSGDIGEIVKLPEREGALAGVRTGDKQRNDCPSAFSGVVIGACPIGTARKRRIALRRIAAAEIRSPLSSRCLQTSGSRSRQNRNARMPKSYRPLASPDHS